MTYIKENVISTLQKLYSPPKKLKVDNELPMPLLKKHLCTSDLSPACKIFIERPEKGGEHLKISVWYLLMNLKNNYLFKKLLKWANKKCKNLKFRI